MRKEFTATVYILEEKFPRLLLIFHKKLQKWLPPGGHIDPEETPPEAAVREAKEETGLDIELIPQENVWIPPRLNGKSIERPYLTLLEEIPPYQDTPAHQHVDQIFLGRVVGGVLKQNTEETLGLKWFTLEEVRTLECEKEIYFDTRLIIEHLFQSRYAPSHRASALEETVLKQGRLPPLPSAPALSYPE